jgi:hypothetical protein
MFVTRGVSEARVVPCVGMLVAVLSYVCVSDAWAQTSPDVQPPPSAQPPDATAPETTTPTQSSVVRLPTIRVSPTKPKTNGEREKPAQPEEQQTVQPPPSPYATGAPNVAGGASVQPNAASQLTVSGAQVNAVPFSRPGEALEVVPGLIITQHSGEGKANQYFLRGYNLDHGTDLAITYDGVPMNQPTHAHGQGYADLNMLIPELIGSVNIRKGPYYADVGDFGSVGAVSINLRDTIPKNVAQITSGSFGYVRFLGYGSTAVGAGNLLYAAEAATYNGPWSNPDDMRKFNGLLRYSQGSNLNGFTVTGLAYSNKWNSTDQVPLRAITSGQLGLHDAFDPTDGGNASRFSLSARLAETDDKGAWLANAYAVKSKLDLYNNFTYFLTDPVNGDQFHQHDDRVLAGANASRTINGSFGSLPTETTFGVQSWYNNIDLSLSNTVARQFLSYTRSDHVDEGTVGIYAQNVLHWTPWLRTIVGLREDVYTANVKSFFDPANSGNANAAITSPKFSLVLGPFYKTEFYVSAGTGFHSNDARGVTITEDPTNPSDKLTPSPFLVQTEGAEFGIRTKLLPGLNSSLSLSLCSTKLPNLYSPETRARPNRAGQAGASVSSGRTSIDLYRGSRLMPIWQ